MPTSLPTRIIVAEPRTPPSAYIAVALIYAVLIVMTLHVPALDPVGDNADAGHRALALTHGI